MSERVDKIAEEIQGLSLLEASELVKKLEEKFFKCLMIGSTMLILSMLIYILYIIIKKNHIIIAYG